MAELLVFALSLALLTAASGAEAAAPAAAKLRSIGFLSETNANSAGLAAIKKALRDLNYVEGETVSFRSRGANGRIEQIDSAAAELLSEKIDLIVAEGVSAGQAARRQTRSVPIVVASLIEPVRAAGNVTGATNISPDLGVQRLRLLKEMAPKISRVTVLWHEVNPIPPAYLKQVRKAADSLGVEIDPHRVKSAGQLQATFDALAANKDDGLILEPQLLFAQRFGDVIALAAKARLATISGVEEFAAAGGLASYGLNAEQMWHHTAVLIDRIFNMRKPKSGQPAELPASQPDKLELVINLHAAGRLGLAIPPDVLKRADKVLK
jgi:putative tryptophan/tyrosine transport system substrate-binding protein